MLRESHMSQQVIGITQGRPGGGARMSRGRTTMIAGALLALVALAAPLGWAWAQVTIETQPRESAPPGVVVTPPPAPGTTTIPATIPGTVTVPQTLQADEIKANQVRANTIYANKIEADQIRGMIHQSRGVKVSHAEGEV